MRHLRCFLEVARQRSITKAAEALNTVQPALSRTLRELEDEIGQPLFERTGQGLVLTMAGETFMRYVGTGMSQIQMGLRQMRDHGGNQAVTMGMLPNVVRTLVPRAVARFKDSAPHIDVRLVTSGAPDMIARLRQGEIDFLIGRLLSLEDIKGISFEPLYAESLTFVVRPDHPLAGRKQVTLQDIDAHLVLAPFPNTIIRKELDKFCVGHGLAEFSNKIETISFEFIRAYLVGHDAVACVPLGAVRQELAGGRLARLDIHGDELVGSVGLTFIAGREINPAAAQLAEIIREEAAAYGEP